MIDLPKDGTARWTDEPVSTPEILHEVIRELEGRMHSSGWGNTPWAVAIIDIDRVANFGSVSVNLLDMNWLLEVAPEERVEYFRRFAAGMLVTSTAGEWPEQDRDLIRSSFFGWIVGVEDYGAVCHSPNGECVSRNPGSGNPDDHVDCKKLPYRTVVFYSTAMAPIIYSRTQGDEKPTPISWSPELFSRETEQVQNVIRHLSFMCAAIDFQLEHGLTAN